MNTLITIDRMRYLWRYMLWRETRLRVPRYPAALRARSAGSRIAGATRLRNRGQFRDVFVDAADVSGVDSR